MIRFLTDYLTILASCASSAVGSRWPKSGRRLRFLLLFLLLLPPLVVVGRLTMLLDHLFFPGFDKVKIARPIFIVGQARTGTTYLHRLMARDTDTFASFRLVDFILPSITMKRCAALLGQVDAALGGLGRGLVEWLDRAFLPVFAKIHEVGIYLPEEDEYLLYHRLLSGSLWFVFPDVARFRRLLFLDTEARPEERREVMAFYADQVRRHLYHLGPNKTLLSKNPWFTAKIDALAEAFPDARFVKLERTPLEAIPSCASMVHFVWHNTGAKKPGERDVETLLDLYGHYDRHARERFAALGPERAHTVRYADFVAGPAGSVEQLCGALDIPVSADLARILAAEGAREKHHRSKHRYSLADWGLTAQQVAERFPEAFAENAFPLPEEDEREG